MCCPDEATPSSGPKRSGTLFIVSGPSGAGKGTLVSALRSRVPDLWVSVSATTRAPRPQERDGLEYHFVSDETFDRLIAEGGLIEWAEVHGNRYGTPRELVETHVALGEQVILEIDPQGAFQVRDRYPDSVLLFILPPSLDELKRRLADRGSETEEQVSTRMRTAERELELVGNYDHVIINDDVGRAADELARIIDSYADHQRQGTQCQ